MAYARSSISCDSGGAACTDVAVDVRATEEAELRPGGALAATKRCGSPCSDSDGIGAWSDAVDVRVERARNAASERRGSSDVSESEEPAARGSATPSGGAAEGSSSDDDDDDEKRRCARRS